ncbi:collagen-like protein [uncultured Actinomyces sp.]|uniref:collagen-like protein n=1 Tax=uncultured Actinomyces sp. TaxID=249061 RepID=UPI0025D68EA5|nr:collagen-like protein [uncultured Actinomyces sp.]
MTQPPNPGQPFYQQQPSAPSAPATGQPYPPQQQFQGAPGAQGVQGAPGAPGAPGVPGAPGQPFPPAQTGDSFMGNFFDTAKPFAEKFGKPFFFVAVAAFIASWIYDSGLLSTSSYGNDYGQVFLKLFFTSPWVFVEIGLVRLFLELVSSSCRKNQ